MAYRIPYETMRRRYLNALKAMQHAITITAGLKLRNEILEAENKALHARLDGEQKCA